MTLNISLRKFTSLLIRTVKLKFIKRNLFKTSNDSYISLSVSFILKFCEVKSFF